MAPITKGKYPSLEPNRPRYPSESKIPNHPGVGYYSFPAGPPGMALPAGQNLILQGRVAGHHYNTEHVLEFQCFRSFIRSLDHRELPDGTTSAFPSLSDTQVVPRLPQSYHVWAAANVPTSHTHTIPYEAIKSALGDQNNVRALCFLDDDLNRLKSHVWNTKQRPIADLKWTGQLRFDVYGNVNNIERKFCQVVGVFEYMIDQAVTGKFRAAFGGISNELGIFANAYNRVYGTNIDLTNRWREFVTNQLNTMANQTETWFISKFDEFIGNEPKWIQANGALAPQIRARSQALRNVRDHAVNTIEQVRGII